MDNTIRKEQPYDFDLLSAYEIESVKKESDGKVTIVLKEGKLSGVMRHCVAQDPAKKNEKNMVQILNGSVMSAPIPTKNLLFTFEKL